MKKFTITFDIKQLFTAFIGVVLAFSIYSFVSSDKSENLAFDDITLAEAQTYYQSNLNTEQPFGGGTHAVCVTLDQLDAMKSINRSTAAVGFRCYFAKDAEGNNISIVVGVDGESKDITSKIKKASAGLFATCPNVCDEQSPITSQ